MFFRSVGQLNVSLALESGGASASVTVHLMSVSEGVCLRVYVGCVSSCVWGWGGGWMQRFGREGELTK